MRKTIEEAETIATSILAYVEARAAFARRHREKSITAVEHSRIVKDLDRDWDRYLVVEINEPLIRSAGKLAETHSLRAYDAIHLASANFLKQRLKASLSFASWDTQLEAAAQRQGLYPFRSQLQ